MDDGKAGYLGSKVDLRCRFINSFPPVKISQVFSCPLEHMDYFTLNTKTPKSDDIIETQSTDSIFQHKLCPCVYLRLR